MKNKYDSETQWELNIQHAIARSISHTEITRLSCEDPSQAVSYIEETYDDVDHARENDGDLDVWGNREGEEFRLRISKG